MGTINGPATRSDLDRIAENRLEIRRLTEAWTRRHRLRRGTPEYDEALQIEERLVTRVWRRLRTEGRSEMRTPIKD